MDDSRFRNFAVEAGEGNEGPEPEYDPVFDAVMNHVVMSTVMKNLGPKDLLRCAVVCKLWNSVATPIIHSRHRRVLALDHHDDGLNLRKLTELLINDASMLIPPIRGLSVSYDRPVAPYHKRPFLLPQVEVRNESAWEDFLRALLTKAPNLDSIRLNTGAAPSPATVVGVTKILEAFKSKLNRLGLTSDWLHRVGGLVNERPETLKELRFGAAEADLATLEQFLNSDGAEVERIWFSSVRQLNGKVNQGFWNHRGRVSRVLNRLLTYRTLSDVCIDVFDLLLLQNSNSLPYVDQLSELTLIVDNALVTEEGRDLLGLIDFDVYFPNVKHIKFWFASGRYDELDHFRSGESGQQFGSDIAKSTRISTLSFFGEGETCSVRPIFLQECAKWFPNVKHLWFHTPQKDSWLWGPFFRTIFEHWGHIEALTLANTPVKAMELNFDHVFCGHHPDVLNGDSVQQSPKGLVQLESSQPAFSNLKNLRTLNVEVDHSSGCLRRQEDPGRVWLSETAGQFALCTLPDLTIRVFRTGHEYLDPCYWFTLDHLAPYVRVETHDARLRLLYDL